MLEAVSRQPLDTEVFRYVNKTDSITALSEMGLGGAEIAEVSTFVGVALSSAEPSEIIDSQFKERHFFKPTQTRFSDGTLRVFYSALERATAEAEVVHWFLKREEVVARKSVTYYYVCARCHFAGVVADLRPYTAEWRFLTANDGYVECNALGKEAAESGLDGLLAPSARRPGGTNVPVFQKRSLTSPAYEHARAFSYDGVLNVVKLTSV